MAAIGLDGARAAIAGLLDPVERGEDVFITRGPQRSTESGSGLRAGDALHLAVASDNAARGVYSLDRTMVAVGHPLGLPMNAGFPAAI